jgi:hypothetical protein
MDLEDMAHEVFVVTRPVTVLEHDSCLDDIIDQNFRKIEAGPYISYMELGTGKRLTFDEIWKYWLIEEGFAKRIFEFVGISQSFKDIKIVRGNHITSYRIR